MTDATQKTGPGLDQDSHLSFSGPLAPPAGKILIWRRDAGGPAADDHEDLMLWRVPSSLAHRFRGAAEARGLTPAQHLSALVSLHETMRQQADAGDDHAAALLGGLGLGTVSI